MNFQLWEIAVKIMSMYFEKQWNLFKVGFCCYDKTLTKVYLERKEFISSQTSRSLEEVWPGTKAETTAECFSHLLPVACQACFLILPRTALQGITQPTIVWNLPHQSLRKMSPQLCPQPSWWRQFLNGGSLFLSAPSLCQVDKN